MYRARNIGYGSMKGFNVSLRPIKPDNKARDGVKPTLGPDTTELGDPPKNLGDKVWIPCLAASINIVEPSYHQGKGVTQSLDTQIQ